MLVQVCRMGDSHLELRSPYRILSLTAYRSRCPLCSLPEIKFELLAAAEVSIHRLVRSRAFRSEKVED